MRCVDEHRLAHYPELRREPVGALLRRLLRELGYEPERVDDATIIHRARRAQLGTASMRRLFVFTLWDRGVSYGRGATDSPRAVADAIAAFVLDQKTVDDVEDLFPFVTFAPAARAHERGELVPHRWSELLAARHASPLLVAAHARPKLRRLVPFVDLRALRFSRTTGQPYTVVDAWAAPSPDDADRYEAFAGERSLGAGDAAWAAAALEDAVPDDVGEARDGTADG